MRILMLVFECFLNEKDWWWFWGMRFNDEEEVMMRMRFGTA
jgi:hypothetical protein